jgi:hypothetical protein
MVPAVATNVKGEVKIASPGPIPKSHERHEQCARTRSATYSVFYTDVSGKLLLEFLNLRTDYVVSMC